jgi:hypothetical protein
VSTAACLQRHIRSACTPNDKIINQGKSMRNTLLVCTTACCCECCLYANDVFVLLCVGAHALHELCTTVCMTTLAVETYRLSVYLQCCTITHSAITLLLLLLLLLLMKFCVLFRLKPTVESSWQWHHSCSAATPLDVLNNLALLCSAQLQYGSYHWQQP